MNKRNFVIAIVFSSIFGGIVALAGFSILGPKQTIIRQVADNNPAELTNYVFDTSDFIVPEGLNFVFAAKNSTSSVVHIRTSYTAGSSSHNPFNDFFREYFGERYDRGGERHSRGAGSGVVISNDGYIVTNNHVVENASEIEVVLNDNRSYSAKVVGIDGSTDLAVIKIKENDLRPIQFGSSDNIQVGEWVLAIGNPFEFRSTVTAGIVSAKGRNINILRAQDRVESFIQTDAAVNPGNSGGALVNLKGELIGINTAIASPSGAFAGYSFAVPSSLVKKVVGDLIEYGTVQRALLGIQIRDVNAQLAEQEDLDVVKGVYVASVGDNSAAQIAGIKEGDVIISINEVGVNSVAQLQEQIAINRPGDEVLVTYIRRGKQTEVLATLKNSSGTTEIVEVSNDFEYEGAKFEEVSEELARELELRGGVQLMDLGNGKWKSAGLREGFIITRIDRRDIISMNDFEQFMNSPREDGILIEGIYPNGDKAYYGLGL